MARRTDPLAPSGILNLHKPVGMTSRQAVDRVCRLLGLRRVGHAGTLDSTASGVLVVCVGRATKCVEAIQQMPKTYRASLRLGCRSPSNDAGTPAEPSPAVYAPPEWIVRRFLTQSVGRIPQRVPNYSAVHHKGRRLHKLARGGGSVPAKVKLVTIHWIELLDYAFPDLTIDMRCGKGTYVRSVARDLGEALGIGAIVQGLRRTAIGPFRLADAVPLEGGADTETLRAALQPPDRVLPDRPA